MLTGGTAGRTRRLTVAAVIAGANILVAACGSGDAEPASSAAPAPSSETAPSAEPAQSAEATRSSEPALSDEATRSSDPALSDEATRSSDPARSDEPLPGVTGELIITRQRDLLDRGLINVQFRNDSDVVMEMTDRQLVADHFTTDPAAPRTSKIPNGRPVDLQVPYGTATDCESTTPVAARLEFTYSTDVAGEPTSGVVALTGTELLDEIRAEQCAQRTVETAYELHLTEPVVDGERLHAQVVVTPTTDDPPTLDIDRSGGTILVDATAIETPLVITGEEVRTPVVFEVIRCDPHAMAEVTKRFGLELSISIDGAAPQPVDVDVDALGDELETIVANCRQRTASES